MSGWERMDDDAWPFVLAAVREKYGTREPWPEPLAVLDLRWMAGARRMGAMKASEWPTVRDLASRWNWTTPKGEPARDKAAAFLLDTIRWQDPERRQSLVSLRGDRGSVEVDNDDGSEFEPPGTLTHADVVARAVGWLRSRHGCSVVFAEMSTSAPLIPDAIGWTKWWSVYVECKVSRSDFAADRKKPIHDEPDAYPGQERWYLTPPNLVRPDEVPDAWGLAEVGKRSVRVVKLPARAAGHGVETIPSRSDAELPYLLSAIRRHQVGARWVEETARFETMAARDEREGKE